MMKFRPNVAAVILNQRGDKILMFHRVDGRRKGWQFPQGGVDPGETEEQAILRELNEEIGTNDVKILKQSSKRTRYQFPKAVLKRMQQKNRWRQYCGQEQRWFLVQLNQGTETLSLSNKGHKQEFDRFKWMRPKVGLRKVVRFKRKAYRKGLKRLGVI
ncbi:MAG: RNA pyrophosphohydrolase [Deltaproteobacteria bacterium]|jgi:putative (di)nucleoside polyphosphate hydrolase